MLLDASGLELDNWMTPCQFARLQVRIHLRTQPLRQMIRKQVLS